MEQCPQKFMQEQLLFAMMYYLFVFVHCCPVTMRLSGSSSSCRDRGLAWSMVLGQQWAQGMGISLDTSSSWKCRGSTSTLRGIIYLHAMLWKFKSLGSSVTKDADPFTHPLVLQHPACNSLPSFLHPFAVWVLCMQP